MTCANAVTYPLPMRRAGGVLGRCVLEARPTVLMISLMRYLCGFGLGGWVGGPHLSRMIIGALAWELAVFFVYLINGVMDVHEDRINASGRPIARGALSARTAGRVAWAAAALSVCLAVTLGARFVVALVAILAVGYLYSAPPLYLKRRPVGTAVTGALIGLLTYYGGHAASAGTAVDGPLPIFAIIMSLWMALVGAPAKDLPDIIGDAAAGRRTLAMLVEESKLRRLIAATALGLATAFVAPALVRTSPLLPPALTMLAGSVAVGALCLSRISRYGRTSRRRPYRAFMVTQYLVHIVALTRVTILS